MERTSVILRTFVSLFRPFPGCSHVGCASFLPRFEFVRSFDSLDTEGEDGRVLTEHARPANRGTQKAKHAQRSMVRSFQAILNTCVSLSRTVASSPPSTLSKLGRRASWDVGGREGWALRIDQKGRVRSTLSLPLAPVFRARRLRRQCGRDTMHPDFFPPSFSSRERAFSYR